MSETNYTISLLDYIDPKGQNSPKNSSVQENGQNSNIEKSHSKEKTAKELHVKPIINQESERKPIKRRKNSQKKNILMKIGEVAELFDINTSVLRFWENTFAELKPTRTKTGQRLYKEEDILLIKKLIKLLHEDKLTIEGAKKAIQKKSSSQIKLPKAKKKKISAISLDVKIISTSRKAKENIASSPKSNLSQNSTETIPQALEKSIASKEVSPIILKKIAHELEQIKNILNK